MADENGLHDSGDWRPTQGEMWRMLRRLEKTASDLHEDIRVMKTTLDKLTAERALVGGIAALALGALLKWWLGG